MENNTLPERLSKVSNHQLVRILSVYPVWESFIGMLKPIDIVSFMRATMFRIRLTEQEIKIYIKWWRETFYNMKWVTQNEGKITVISKDLARLNYALERWYYFNTIEMKLLVVVKETLPVGEVRDAGRRAMIKAIDTSYMWGVNAYHVPLLADAP
jgi:hypothetical protein